MIENAIESIEDEIKESSQSEEIVRVLIKVRKDESAIELTDCNGIGGRSRRGHDEETRVVVDGLVGGDCWSVVERELGFGGRKASASLCEYR